MKKIVAMCVLGFAYSETFDLGKIEATNKNSVDYNSEVITIGKEAIKNSGAKDLAEAIKEVTGIFYQPSFNARGEPGISIRGINSQHIGIFYDGIPIHSIYDRQTDWSQFSTFGISEINISKGYISPIYGMNTLGGAVNIVSNKPAKEVEFSSSYRFISDNENQIGIQLGQNFKNYYYQIGYSYVDRDYYRLSKNFEPTIYQKDRKKVNSYYTNKTLSAKAGITPNENNEYSINIIYQKGEKGGMISASSGGNFWNWPHYDKLTTYILGKTSFSNNIYLNSRVFYDSFDNELQSLGRLRDNGNIGGGYMGRSIYDDYTLGAIFDISYELDNKKITTGLNLKNDHHNSQSKLLNGTNDGDKEQLVDITSSIFTQYSHDFDNLRFVLSGSYDRNDVIDAKIKDKTKKAYDASKENQDSWTLQGIIYYYLNDYTTIHTNIGRKGKILTLKDRYSDTWGERVRNPKLEPETAINYELGTTFDLPTNTKISTIVFYNNLNNMIVTEYLPDDTCKVGTNCYRLINEKDGYSYGAEIAINQSWLDDKVSIATNYSFVKRKVENKGSFSRAVDGSRIQDYPEHIINVNTKISPTKKLDLITIANYHSKTFYSNNQKWQKNGSVFLLDLRANYRFYKNFTLHIGAYNILDRNYKYGNGYYMNGRRIFAGMEYNF